MYQHLELTGSKKMMGKNYGKEGAHSQWQDLQMQTSPGTGGKSGGKEN